MAYERPPPGRIVPIICSRTYRLLDPVCGQPFPVLGHALCTAVRNKFIGFWHSADLPGLDLLGRMPSQQLASCHGQLSKKAFGIFAVAFQLLSKQHVLTALLS
jgi:hypothetical protein